MERDYHSWGRVNVQFRRRENVKEIERLIGKEEILRRWKKEEILQNLKYIWKTACCIIE